MKLLHYDRALTDGLPVATGVIEGACRHLVENRMGRTGARWSAAGAEAILRLRALRASGDFDDYWTFHLAKEHERTSVTLRRQGRAQPAAATSAEAAAGQVIVFPVDPRRKRAASVTEDLPHLPRGDGSRTLECRSLSDSASSLDLCR